ncbi:MAG TPA: VWA domain-containing protein [Blastocatellia bacterium]|nr:VWA domain-containing protein [Blastocatellia bacterium]
MLGIEQRSTGALVLIGLLAASVNPQSGRVRIDQKSDDKATITLRAEEVLLPVSVRSDAGKLPGRLDHSDFIVTEDGKRQRITSVMRTPANILFIIDSSGKADAKKDVNLNRDIALRIIDALADDDRAAIITYADRVELLSPWTNNKDGLRDALKRKYKPGIQSEFYQSIVYAADEVLPKVTGRRSVVLISDGVDTIATAGFENALEALHRARATVYAVGQNEMLLGELKPWVFNPLARVEMLDPRTRKRYGQLRQYVKQLEAAEVTLKSLAEETGGAVWTPPTLDELNKTISARVIAELGTEYVLSYVSERAPDDNSFHPVRVYPARAGIQVRARRGIYSNKDSELTRK